MKSTLYLKFIFIYIIFGFLSLFTAATLTENLVRTPIFNRVSNNMYRKLRCCHQLSSRLFFR